MNLVLAVYSCCIFMVSMYIHGFNIYSWFQYIFMVSMYIHGFLDMNKLINRRNALLYPPYEVRTGDTMV